MYFVELKCGEFYKFVNYRGLKHARTTLPVMELEVQVEKGLHYKKIYIHTKTVKNTNVMELM